MCWNKRKPYAISVSVFSGIILCLGIVVFALAIQLQVAKSYFTIQNIDGNAADINVEYLRNWGFGILVSFGFIAFVTGIYGLFFVCCSNRCYAIIFGTFLGVSWVVVLVVGALLTAVSQQSQASIQEFCEGSGAYTKYTAQITT